MEGTMTKQSMISLIAAAVLFAMGSFSIVSAIDGRIGFDSDLGVTITRMNAATAGTDDVQAAMFAGKTLSPVSLVSR
jgi:hypothetical protein